MSANTLQTQMINPAVTEGVISRRVIAFLIDQLVIGCLVGVFYVVVFILGIATLGLAWGLFFILPGIWAVVALLYVFSHHSSADNAATAPEYSASQRKCRGVL